MNAANSRINVLNYSRDVYRSMYLNLNSLCTDTRCVSYCKSLFRTSLMKFSYCKTFWSTLALASALAGGDMFATSALNPDFQTEGSSLNVEHEVKLKVFRPAAGPLSFI